jgi:vancomycin resistance protein VanW
MIKETYRKRRSRRNETNITDSQLVGEWRTIAPDTRSYKVYEKEHWITQEYWGGYIRHNKIHRHVLNMNGDIIDDEFVSENHAIMMYEPFLVEGVQ